MNLYTAFSGLNNNRNESLHAQYICAFLKYILTPNFLIDLICSLLLFDLCAVGSVFFPLPSTLISLLYPSLSIFTFTSIHFALWPTDLNQGCPCGHRFGNIHGSLVYSPLVYNRTRLLLPQNPLLINSSRTLWVWLQGFSVLPGPWFLSCLPGSAGHRRSNWRTSPVQGRTDLQIPWLHWKSPFTREPLPCAWLTLYRPRLLRPSASHRSCCVVVLMMGISIPWGKFSPSLPLWARTSPCLWCSLSCIWSSIDALFRAECTTISPSQQLGAAMRLCTYHSTLWIEMSLLNADNNFYLWWK